MGTQCLTLSFASDEILIASHEYNTNYVIRRLEEGYELWGLTINIIKMKYLTAMDTQKEDPDLHLQKL